MASRILAEPGGHLGQHGGEGPIAPTEREQVEDQRVDLALEPQAVAEHAPGLIDGPAGLHRLESLRQP